MAKKQNSFFRLVYLFLGLSILVFFVSYMILSGYNVYYIINPSIIDLWFALGVHHLSMIIILLCLLFMIVIQLSNIKSNRLRLPLYFITWISILFLFRWYNLYKDGTAIQNLKYVYSLTLANVESVATFWNYFYKAHINPLYLGVISSLLVTHFYIIKFKSLLAIKIFGVLLNLAVVVLPIVNIISYFNIYDVNEKLIEQQYFFIITGYVLLAMFIVAGAVNIFALLNNRE